MRVHIDARRAHGFAAPKQSLVCRNLLRWYLIELTPRRYGVSRVYSQQCGYVLSDAQHAQNSMRALLKVVGTADLDIDESTAR